MKHGERNVADAAEEGSQVRVAWAGDGAYGHLVVDAQADNSGAREEVCGVIPVGCAACSVLERTMGGIQCVIRYIYPATCGLFGANRGPRPSVDGLVSLDGLTMAGHLRIPRMAWPSAFPTKMKAFWTISI